MGSKEVLTLKETAQLLQISYKTALRLARLADFPAFRCGERKILVSAEGLREWKRRKMAEPLD